MTDATTHKSISQVIEFEKILEYAEGNSEAAIDILKMSQSKVCLNIILIIK